jgi:hypothetical protein
MQWLGGRAGEARGGRVCKQGGRLTFAPTWAYSPAVRSTRHSSKNFLFFVTGRCSNTTGVTIFFFICP